MKPVLMFYLYFLLLVFISDGLHVHGPPGPLVVQLGESVMLPCFVETPPPLEELEVEWKRNDTETLVHLWQDGESRPESQNHLYRERAHFFTEAIAFGNFSLFLKNLSRTDAGVYKCVVYTEQDKAETLIEIKIEHLSVSGGQVVSAYAGEDITLNCFVESHVPAASIEEVSWKKTDEEILVLLYQEGDILTDSTGARYMERVEFFSVEERNKGNFSLRLKNIQIKDKGLYMCLAFYGALSANTTVKVQQLGFSTMHIGVLLLCILGFVIGSLILGYLSYTTYKNNEDSRRAVAIQIAHLLCPNIALAIVFILWGVTEGDFTEAATCSALNFVRIPFLLWIALHLKPFQDNYHRFINQSAIPLQHGVITAVAYYRIYVEVFSKVNSDNSVLVIILLLLHISFLTAIITGYFRRLQRLQLGITCSCTEINNCLRTFYIIIMYGLSPSNLTAALFPFLIPMWLICKCPNSVVYISVMMLLEFASASGSIYIHYALLINEKERDALTCMSAFLQILTLMVPFTFLNYSSDSESDSTNTETRGSVYHAGVFMFGTVVVVFVNAAALLVELILSARNGQRTVDLRVILLLTESIFAMCCLALQISTFWKKRRLKEELQTLIRRCGCKQTVRASPPLRDERELETLSADPRPLGF